MQTTPIRIGSHAKQHLKKQDPTTQGIHSLRNKHIRVVTSTAKVEPTMGHIRLMTFLVKFRGRASCVHVCVCVCACVFQVSFANAVM